MEVVTEITVRYEETDRMGVAYYANYFVWFEVGRTAFLREAGVPYREMEDVHKIILPVVEAYCKYRKSVGFDEKVRIFTSIKDVRRRGLTFCYRLEGDGGLLAEGYTRHVVVNPEGRPRSFTDEIYQLLKRVEHGDNKA